MYTIEVPLSSLLVQIPQTVTLYNLIDTTMQVLMISKKLTNR